MQRVLNKDELLKTAEGLARDIDRQFSASGLTAVAAEVVKVTQEAMVRAERIRRPNILLRLGLVLLVVIAVVGVVVYLKSHEGELKPLELFFKLLDATKGSAAFLAAVAIFLVTLEFRLKRWRALQAIHELRAMAHIIDMHQLAKNPERFALALEPIQVSGRTMSPDQMAQYLHLCTELLAIVSKIGQLYVQDFPDATALAAEDQFEGLATGLSSKIWQKLMILQQLRVEAAEVKAAGRMGDLAGVAHPAAPAKNA